MHRWCHFKKSRDNLWKKTVYDFTSEWEQSAVCLERMHKNNTNLPHRNGIILFISTKELFMPKQSCNIFSFHIDCEIWKYPCSNPQDHTPLSLQHSALPWPHESHLCYCSSTNRQQESTGLWTAETVAGERDVSVDLLSRAKSMISFQQEKMMKAISKTINTTAFSVAPAVIGPSSTLSD